MYFMARQVCRCRAHQIQIGTLAYWFRRQTDAEEGHRFRKSSRVTLLEHLSARRRSDSKLIPTRQKRDEAEVNWGGEKNAIDAVEASTVTGHDRARVFDVGNTL